MQTTLERGWEMKKVKAKTAKLLEAIKANLEAHKEAYKQAYGGYKITALEALAEYKTKSLKDIKELREKIEDSSHAKGDAPVSLYLPSAFFADRPPEDHSKDYEVVIKMLEFETEETVEIMQDQFECYVMDRWKWKDEFVASNRTYAAKLPPIHRSQS